MNIQQIHQKVLMILYATYSTKQKFFTGKICTQKKITIKLHLETSTLSSITCLVSKSSKIWNYARQERLPWKEADKNLNRNNNDSAYTCYISIYQLWQRPTKTAILLQAFCHPHCNCIGKQEQTTLVCLLRANNPTGNIRCTLQVLRVNCWLHNSIP